MAVSSGEQWYVYNTEKEKVHHDDSSSLVIVAVQRVEKTHLLSKHDLYFFCGHYLSPSGTKDEPETWEQCGRTGSTAAFISRNLALSPPVGVSRCFHVVNPHLARVCCGHRNGKNKPSPLPAPWLVWLQRGSQVPLCRSGPAFLRHTGADSLFSLSLAVPHFSHNRPQWVRNWCFAFPWRLEKCARF